MAGANSPVEDNGGTVGRAIAVTKSDTVDHAVERSRGLYIGGAGSVVCIPEGNNDDEPVTFAGLAAGTFLPVRTRRVYSTGTTATNILVLY